MDRWRLTIFDGSFNLFIAPLRPNISIIVPPTLTVIDTKTASYMLRLWLRSGIFVSNLEAIDFQLSHIPNTDQIRLYDGQFTWHRCVEILRKSISPGDPATGGYGKSIRHFCTEHTPIFHIYFGISLGYYLVLCNVTWEENVSNVLVFYDCLFMVHSCFL